MSPSPSARISASAPSQSRSVSHSAGCPLCDLWCTNPDLPAEGKNETSKSQEEITGGENGCFFLLGAVLMPF